MHSINYYKVVSNWLSGKRKNYEHPQKKLHMYTGFPYHTNNYETLRYDITLYANVKTVFF